MHGFVYNPALAKLVALQMIDEQLQQSRRSRKTRTFRARLAVRRTRAAAPVKSQRLTPTVKLAGEGS